MGDYFKSFTLSFEFSSRIPSKPLKKHINSMESLFCKKKNIQYIKVQKI